MKILVAAASFASSISGLQRHAFNLVRCLLLRPEISALDLVVAPWQRHLVEAAGFDLDARLRLHTAEMDRSSLSRNLWHYRQLPRLAAQLRSDLVHLTYPMPINAAALGCPSVVTLHDLYPIEIPRNFAFPNVIFNRIVLRQCLRSVDAIACVSEVTRARLKQYASPAVWQKGIRIYNCVESGPASASQSPIPGWQGNPFLLCIAQHRRNKNLRLLIRAFHRVLHSTQVSSNTVLVIVGITGPETIHIQQLVSDLGLNSQVHFLEGLPEAGLQWCYRQCELLLSPSITEGFGLPIAEGLLAGCRIVCSDIPAHREIGDGRCRFVMLQEGSEETLAVAIVAGLQDPKRQPTVLPQLSGPVLSKQYISLYHMLTASVSSAEDFVISPPVSILIRKVIDMTEIDSVSTSQCRESEHERI